MNMEFELKRPINKENIEGDNDEEEPPFEFPIFSFLHDLFRPPLHALRPTSEAEEENDVVTDEKIPLPNWMACVDVDDTTQEVDPVEAEHIRQSAFNILKSYSNDALMMAGTPEQQDHDARIPPEKLVGRWIIVKGIGLGRVTSYDRVTKLERMKQDSVHTVELAEETPEGLPRRMRMVLRRRKLGYWNNGMRFIIAEEDQKSEDGEEAGGEVEKQHTPSGKNHRRDTVAGGSITTNPLNKNKNNTVETLNESWINSWSGLLSQDKIPTVPLDITKSGWLQLERQPRPSTFGGSTFKGSFNGSFNGSSSDESSIPRYFSLVFPVGSSPRLARLMYSKQPNKVPKADNSHCLSLTATVSVDIDPLDPSRFFIGKWSIRANSETEAAGWVHAIQSAITEFTKAQAATSLDNMFAGSSSGKPMVAKGGVRRASILTPAALPTAGSSNHLLGGSDAPVISTTYIG